MNDAANAVCSTQESHALLSKENPKKYDFIIVGMQEAAFAEGVTRQSMDDTNRNVDGSSRSSIDGGNGRGGGMKKTKTKSVLVRKVDKVCLAFRGLTHTQTHRRYARCLFIGCLLECRMFLS